MNIGKVTSKDYLFGIVRHEKAGEAEVLAIFGLNVFERFGCYKCLLGFKRGKPNE